MTVFHTKEPPENAMNSGHLFSCGIIDSAIKCAYGTISTDMSMV